MKYIFPLSILFACLFPIQCQSIEIDLKVENSNLISYTSSLTDANRLRLDSYLDFAPAVPLSGVLIIDNQTMFERQGQEFDNDIDIYRAYVEYQSDKISIYAGRQRVPFGVGRIWNPIDIFNPINITSAEPEERKGTDALRLEYFPSSLSSIDVTLAERQAAGRIKGFLQNIDLAVVAVIDDIAQRSILGWEISGELLDTGIELRSEGGWFYDRSSEDYHYEYIAGVEYGFTFPLTLIFEYNYNGETEDDSAAMQLNSQLGPLLTASFLTLFSIEDHSLLYAPQLQYSLSDEMTLTFGLFVYNGSGEKLYSGDNQFFLNWFVQF